LSRKAQVKRPLPHTGANRPVTEVIDERSSVAMNKLMQMPRRPNAAKALEAAFSEAVARGRGYEFLSTGIEACLDNALSLAMEFSCLASHGFSARAQFVMATAMEEAGKALILFDLARLPWDRKEAIAGLCKAFYNHLRKAAYAKIIHWPGNGTLEAALVMFKLELIEYWPNRDPESGEPDELADGFVNREWGLYVDWNDFDGRWFSPESSTLAYYYAQEKELNGKRVGETRIEGVLAQLLKARDEKLFTAKGLEIAHSVMSRLDVTTTTSEEAVIAAIEEISQRLSENGIALSDATKRSNFICYPLYAAILTPDKINGYWES
jgi:AbiV family abortive infection protein